MKGKYNMNTKQNLFTEEELAKVTDEAERKHLIECAQDQSKIDMKYMEIMSKYDLWEKGKRSRYFHATTHENAKKIMQDGVIRKGIDGGAHICKQPLEAARFVAIRGHETGTIFEVELEERKVVEAHDHNEAFFGCKAYMYMDDIPTQKIVKISRYSTEQEDDKE